MRDDPEEQASYEMLRDAVIERPTMYLGRDFSDIEWLTQSNREELQRYVFVACETNGVGLFREKEKSGWGPEPELDEIAEMPDLGKEPLPS